MASTYISLPLQVQSSTGVDSFNSRTGIVIPADADYTASQIVNVPSDHLAPANVQDALDSLANRTPGGYTPGSVLFAGAGSEITEDAPNFAYTNDFGFPKLGIGTNAPQRPLHISGEPNPSSGQGFRVTNLLPGGGDFTFITTDDSNGEGGGHFLFINELAAYPDNLTLAIAASGNVILGGPFLDDGSGRVQVIGDLSFQSAGTGLKLKEGSDAKMGQATLIGGTLTISTTAVTASSRIWVSRADSNSSTALGTLEATNISAGISFDINSKKSNSTLETNDVSIVNWLIIEAT